MQPNKMVSGKEFRDLLVREKGSLTHHNLIVEDDLTIDGGEIPTESIGVDNVTFIGMVSFRNLARVTSMHFRGSNFRGGLLIEQIGIHDGKGGHLSIHSGKAKYIDLWNNQLEGVSLADLEISGNLDVSGLDLSKGLCLERVSYEKLELIQSHTDHAIKTPMVRTDDPVAAFQFRMAGIPVYVSTEQARQWLSTKEGKKLAASA